MDGAGQTGEDHGFGDGLIFRIPGGVVLYSLEDVRYLLSQNKTIPFEPLTWWVREWADN